MSKEDVYVPQFEPAATEYDPNHLDRSLTTVRDTFERLRNSLASDVGSGDADLEDLEGVVTSIQEDIYDPDSGLAATRARIITEEGVRASADTALAARATTLEATVNDGTTGLVATRARLITEESTRATADSALATRATNLEATVNDGTTGLVATRARLITEESTRATADSALSTRASTLEATVNDGVTGVAATRARLITEESTRASADSALATRATTLESIASSGAPGANLVPNSSLQSLDGYEWTSAGTGPPTNPTGYINVSRLAVGAETVIDERSPRFRVRPNQRYGFAARLAPHRATASVRLEFLDASAAFINNSPLYVGGTSGGAASGDPATLATVGNFATSPSNAVFGRVVVRLAGTGENDPFVFWQAMDCFQASEGQTTLRPYQDGPPLDRTADLVTTVARIATEESTRASADSALASRATTLEAQMANTSASGLQSRIATEESARASADSAQASQITSLTARTNGNPNLFPAPTPVNLRTPAQQGWSGTPIGNLNAPWVGGLVYYKARSGGGVVTEYYIYDVPGDTVLGTADQYTLSACGYGGTGLAGDRLQMRIEIMDPTLTTILHASPLVTLNDRSQRVSTTTNYGGSFLNPVRLRVVFAREWAASGSYQDVVFNAIKLEQGTVATTFTNTAQVIVQSDAIATINDSAAFYQILVAASGGDPALIRLFSGLGGSEVAIAAKIISLINTSSGVAMPVMRATGGLAFFQRPISSDFGGRRVTLGPGFGVSGSEVVLWFGVDTIAPDSQSRTNGIFALGTDGIVYYGGALIQTGSMQMTLSSYINNLTRLGTGTTSISVTATGFAPGTLSYSWTLHSGDAVNISSPSSATTNIGHTLTALGQTKTSVVKCTVTSSAGPSTFQLYNISSSEIS